MQRPIKFRQAIFKDGKFHHWHYWGYVSHRDEFVAPITIGQQSWNKTYDVKDSQQYIGLRSGPVSTGKEIYEGDIIKASYESEEPDICEVAYLGDNGYPAFDLVPYLETDCNSLSYYKAVGDMAVIGNIHENPELLK